MYIEAAMRRRHRRPHIWGSAGCDSFCELWRVNVRRCVSTGVDLYGSWQFLGGSWQLLLLPPPPGQFPQPNLSNSLE